MLKSWNSLICAALASAGLALAAAEARAGLFDFLKPKREAAAVRAQSPEGRTFGAGTYSQSNLWQPQSSSVAGGAQSSWAYDAAPGGNYASYDFGGGGATVNCGECDPHQGRVSFCRKLSHQTYYPRSAPYCAPDWGWNQTCWRRIKDNYNCPRPDSRGSCPEPPTALPPQTPVMPPTTTYLPPPPNFANRPVSSQRVSYGQRPRFGASSPTRGHANEVADPESATEAGEWEYEEEAEPQPVTAPPHKRSTSNYYVPSGRMRP